MKRVVKLGAIEATVDGGRVMITIGGVYAGQGGWTGGRIEDCPVPLEEGEYEALEAGLRDAVRDEPAIRWVRTDLSDGATEKLTLVRLGADRGALYCEELGRETVVAGFE